MALCKTGKSLYCIFSRWPEHVEIDLLDGEKVKKINLLGHDRELTWRVTGKTLQVDIPKLTIDQLPSLHAWTLAITLE